MRQPAAFARFAYAAIAAAALGAGFAAAPARAELETVFASARADGRGVRLVLNWRVPVEYQAVHQGRTGVIRFARPIKADFGPALAILRPLIQDMRMAGNDRVLVVMASREVELRHARVGRSIVLEWGVPVPPPSARRPGQVREVAVRVEKPPMSARGRADEPPAGPPTAGAERPPGGDRPGSDRPGTEPTGPAAPGETATEDGVVTISSANGATRIAVAWREAVPAAVFRHGDHVWLVFPRRARPDLADAKRKLGPGVSDIMAIGHAGATVLRLTVAPEIQPAVAAEGATWLVTLQSRVEGGGPLETPAPRFDPGVPGGGRLLVALPGAAPVIVVSDAALGPALHVVPTAAAAAHMPGERRYVRFRLLKTALGLVVEARSDGLRVDTFDDMVEIRALNGLLISPVEHARP
jgi:hypothetical protein